MSQFYTTEAENEYIIRGNSGILKCKIPSYLSDFLYIDSWIDENGLEIDATETSKNLGWILIIFIVQESMSIQNFPFRKF